MNHVSIFEQKWLDVVFEGKNKNYGAYQLRLQNPRTTIAALFYGLLFLSAAAGILALSSFMNRPDSVPIVDDGPILHPVHMDPIQTPPSGQKAAAPLSKPEKQKPDTNLPPVVAPTNQADPEPTPNPNPATNPTTEPAGTGAPSTSTGTTGTASIPVEIPTTETTVLPAMLDKMPEFPGGIEKFYQYVGRNFEKPDISDTKNVRMFVSFVIEKDGSLTDIKLARDPGYGLGKEAIRVLKSLKVKWEPGLVKGKAVRTLYNLPITVNME